MIDSLIELTLLLCACYLIAIASLWIEC